MMVEDKDEDAQIAYKNWFSCTPIHQTTRLLDRDGILLYQKKINAQEVINTLNEPRKVGDLVYAIDRLWFLQFAKCIGINIDTHEILPIKYLDTHLPPIDNSALLKPGSKAYSQLNTELSEHIHYEFMPCVIYNMLSIVYGHKEGHGLAQIPKIEINPVWIYVSVCDEEGKPTQRRLLRATTKATISELLRIYKSMIITKKKDQGASTNALLDPKPVVLAAPVPPAPSAPPGGSVNADVNVTAETAEKPLLECRAWIRDKKIGKLVTEEKEKKEEEKEEKEEKEEEQEEKDEWQLLRECEVDSPLAYLDFIKKRDKIEKETKEIKDNGTDKYVWHLMNMLKGEYLKLFGPHPNEDNEDGIPEIMLEYQNEPKKWLKKTPFRKDWKKFELNDVIDALDKENKWYMGVITKIIMRDGAIESVKVHFINWATKFDELIDINSARLAPKNTHTVGPYVPKGEKMPNTVGVPLVRGASGLTNMGNTCYMNSTLQCLSATAELSSYFIEKKYIMDVNHTNPLGHSGRFATTYSDFLKDMWSGKYSVVCPHALRKLIGELCEQFRGSTQQDSSELLAFLLDSFHEDLNRIIKKPTSIATNSDGRPDSIVAKEHWDKHILRNQSIIVDKFQGQLKSQLICPVCNKESTSFDPYMFLSLPVADFKSHQHTVKVLFRSPDLRMAGRYCIDSAEETEETKETKEASEVKKQHKEGILSNKFAFDADSDYANCLKTYTIEIPKSCNYKEANEALWKVLPPHLQKLHYVPYKVHNSGIFGTFDGTRSTIYTSDDLWFVEFHPEMLPGLPHMPYYKGVNTTNTSKDKLIGLPFFLQFPSDITYENLKKSVMESMQPLLSDWAKKHFEIAYQPPNALEEGVGKSIDTDGLSSIPLSKKPRLQDMFELALESETVRYSLSRCVRINFENEKKDLKLSPGEIPLINLMWEKEIPELWIKNEVKALKEFDLDDCLRLYTKLETLQDSEAWRCGHCKVPRCASKKIDLWTVPDVLIVHLKRFTNGGRKINTMVACPLENLDLEKWVLDPETKKSAKYELYAVSNHMGSLTGGHYTTNAKNLVDGIWYKFDDSNVRRISPENVVTHSAYVLFYRRMK